MLVTKGKRILAMLLALIMSMGTMAVGTAAADKGTVDDFHKVENLSDLTYTIEADTNFVIVKQANTAVVFLRDNLSEDGQSELKELAAEEDASLNNGVDTWLFFAANENGAASYQGEGNLGEYSIDFNAGTVTISALDKISHLDYGVYTPGEGSDSQEPGQPQEPTPVEPPEAVEWELSKSKEAAGLDENFESKVTLSLPAADYQDDLDVVFVLDSSTSSDKVDLTKTAAGLLNTLAGYHNLTVKVGVVIFGGYEPVLSTTELTVLDSTTMETLRDDVLTTDYNDMKDETDSYKLRSGSNLQAGVEAAREILNGDPNVAAENKYMIILSDGAARVWINEDGESVAQLHVANNWNTTSILSTTWRS